MRRTVALIAAACIAGCASVPSLTPAASTVRQLTQGQAKSCEFVRPIEYVDHIFAFGKNPTLWRSIGDAELRNRAAAAGGNAYVVTSDDMSWFFGDFNFKGEAFRCATTLPAASPMR